MIYKDIVEGIFIKRPNRFIAHVLINGREEIAHVRNTGRCKELLVEGATVFLEPADNPNRKTKFSLIAVVKGDKLINMDSQAPNKVLAEALNQGRQLKGFPKTITKVKPEFTFGDSRLDFCLEHDKMETLVEVKGVTLEHEGNVFFPDAPTLRGVKHLNELIYAKKQGYGAISCFIIKVEKPKLFSPNWKTHPEFAQTLIKAKKAGVVISAFDCKVDPHRLVLNNPVPIVFNEPQLTDVL